MLYAGKDQPDEQPTVQPEAPVEDAEPAAVQDEAADK